jgi:pimeloyl-ACP methyl ester carboxylesterase
LRTVHRRILPLLFLALAGNVAKPAAAPAPDAAPPRFEACRLAHPGGLGSVAAECTLIAVPENRAEPAGRRIELSVIRIPALNRRGRRDPLVLLAGGPGLAASDFYPGVVPAFERIRRERDLLVIDQRGTGRSAPLDCRFDERRMWQAGAAETALLMAECRDRLAPGHDLAQYTTSVAVADLEAVRARLGIAQLNLYGSSYGTRVAQHYARRHPERTRSLILDGVVPPTLVLGPATPLDAQAALDQLFARCRADAACTRAFGDPREDYEALRARLAAAPVALALPDPRLGTPISLDFSLPVFAGALRLLAYNADQAALLPLALKLANRDGLFAPLATQFLLTVGSYGDLVAYGMHNSVVCSEDVPLFASQMIDREQIARTYLGVDQLDALTALCEGWPKGPVDADLHAPLSSAAPALLLSGAADPVTPPAYGERAARGFRHALHLTLAGQGHGQLLAPCVDRLMAEFVARADDAADAVRIDAACVREIRAPPFFLSLAGPGP